MFRWIEATGAAAARSEARILSPSRQLDAGQAVDLSGDGELRFAAVETIRKRAGAVFVIGDPFDEPGPLPTTPPIGQRRAYSYQKLKRFRRPSTRSPEQVRQR